MWVGGCDSLRRPLLVSGWVGRQGDQAAVVPEGAHTVDT